MIEIRDGVEVQWEGGQAVGGWLAVGVDGQFCVRWETLLDKVLPGVVMELDVGRHVVWGVLEERGVRVSCDGGCGVECLYNVVGCKSEAEHGVEDVVVDEGAGEGG